MNFVERKFRSSICFFLVATLNVSTATAAEFLSDQLLEYLNDAPASQVSPIEGELEDNKITINAVPLPVIDPTLGEGVAPVGLATFSLDPEDARSPRSTVGLVYARTNNGSEVYGGGGALYIAEDQYRFDFLAGKADLSLNFFGLGSDFLANNPIPFKLDAKVARIGGGVRFAPNSYIGLRGYFANANMAVDADLSILGRPQLNVELRGAGPYLQYDSRNSTWYPTSGTKAEIRMVHFGDIFDSNGFVSGDPFILSNAEATHYLEVSKDIVAAGKLRTAHAASTAPFFLYPFVQIRGFPALRFLGQNVIQGETELRWLPFRERDGFLSDIGFVAFAGAGVAAADVSGWWDEPVAYAGGFGVRYRISEKDGMNAGLDVAWGRDGESALYFRIGEAF